ncbi:ankyrin repeat domain-containing protein [Desulfococcaceae bacterium HSG9]|nr:ankyrin repeat domain-containing protein [Desulfococcaceae bacterium HSG9]
MENLLSVFNENFGLITLIILCVTPAILPLPLIFSEAIVPSSSYDRISPTEQIRSMFCFILFVINVLSLILWILFSLASESLIHEMAKDGELDRVKATVDKTYIAIDELDYYKRTPLHYAAKSNLFKPQFLEVMEYLLIQGANINAQDKYGNTPLHYAAMNNNEQTVKYLVAEGCETNLTNNQGNTPLHNAIEKNRRKSVEFLLQHGSDLHIKNNQTVTPMGIAKRINDKRVMELIKTYTEGTTAKLETPKQKIERLEQMNYTLIMENKELKVKNTSCEQELKKLKDAPHKLWKTGIELLIKDNFIEAKKTFEQVKFYYANQETSSPVTLEMIQEKIQICTYHNILNSSDILKNSITIQKYINKLKGIESEKLKEKISTVLNLLAEYDGILSLEPSKQDVETKTSIILQDLQVMENRLVDFITQYKNIAEYQNMISCAKNKLKKIQQYIKYWQDR